MPNSNYSVSGTLTNVSQQSKVIVPRPSNQDQLNGSFNIQFDGVCTFTASLLSSSDNGVTWIDTGISYTSQGSYSYKGPISTVYRLKLTVFSGVQLKYRMILNNVKDYQPDDVYNYVTVLSSPYIKQSQYAAPLTATTVTCTLGVSDLVLVVNPAGTIAALTIALPSTPIDGQVVRIMFTQTVTTLTFSNGTVIGGAAGGVIGMRTLVYVASQTQWYSS